MEQTKLYTGQELAKRLLPQASTWTVDHVAAALENLTEWYVERGENSVFDTATVAKEVREMNMSLTLREGIIQQLEQVPFKCEWTLPVFKSDTPGIAVV